MTSSLPMLFASLGDRFEHVHIENQWWDGPRAGVADCQGVACRFMVVQGEDAYLGDEYMVWPIDPEAFELEREQWAIFVGWNDKYESSQCSLESHPATPGVDRRFQELTELLAGSRESVPSDARRLRAEFQAVPDVARYRKNGPAYRVRWLPPIGSK